MPSPWKLGDEGIPEHSLASGAHDGAHSPSNPHGSVAGRVRLLAATESAAADKVQGPSFKGSQWGADIIDRHKERAATLADAAALLDEMRATLEAVNATTADGHRYKITMPQDLRERINAALAKAEGQS